MCCWPPCFWVHVPNCHDCICPGIPSLFHVELDNHRPIIWQTINDGRFQHILFSLPILFLEPSWKITPHRYPAGMKHFWQGQQFYNYIFDLFGPIFTHLNNNEFAEVGLLTCSYVMWNFNTYNTICVLKPLVAFVTNIRCDFITKDLQSTNIFSTMEYK